MLNTFAIAKASEKSWLKLAAGILEDCDKLPGNHPDMARLEDSIDYAYSQSDGGCRARVGITA